MDLPIEKSKCAHGTRCLWLTGFHRNSSRKMPIKQALSFDACCLAAISLFFGHRPNQNVHCLLFRGDSSPFLLENHGHFSPFSQKVKTEFRPVLKRLFEYSNIFEQGFQNKYSNTKIENRVFEKVMNRAPPTMCKPSAAPLGAAAKATSR